MTDWQPKKSTDTHKAITVFHGLCKGCGICIEKCPAKAISFSLKDLGYLSTPAVEVEIKKCLACGLCELHCPDCAIILDKLKK